MTGPSAPNSVTPSRSASDRFLAQQAAVSTPLQVQLQHAQLASQNAELERQLQDLESELSRADVHGKKKLRRLDKELKSIRAELDSALERNKDLEERIGRGSGMSTSTSLTRIGDDMPIRSWAVKTLTETPGHDDAWLIDLLSRASAAQPLPDTDHDEPGDDSASDLPAYQARPALSKVASTPANLSRFLPGAASPQEVDLFAKLISKVSELQRTNVEMAEERTQADLKLSHAEAESDELQRRYRVLEEKIVEVELRDRSSPLRRKRESIEWHSPAKVREYTSLKVFLLMQNGQTSLFGDSPQRKAPGNQSMIERHRRLSSLQASSFLSPNAAVSPDRHRYGSAPLAESPSRLAPPAGSLQRSSSGSTRLSVSPSRSIKPSLSRSASNVSEFFEHDGWEREQTLAQQAEPNLLESLRQRSNADRDLLRRSQHLLDQDDILSIGETSEDWRRMYDFKTSISPSTSFDAISRESISPSISLKKLGHGRHTLASELGALWTETDTKEKCAEPSTEAKSDGTVVLNTSLASTAPALIALVTKDRKSPIVKRGLAEDQEDEDDEYRSLLSSSPPNAESYDSLQLALHDLPITWADDLILPRPRLAIKDVERRLERSSFARQADTSHLGWTYDDPEDSNSDHDPWKEEEEASSRAKTMSQLAVECREAVEAREKADERAARRRRRLQELAREMMADDAEEDDEEYSEESWEKKMRALRRLGSESSLEAMDKEATLAEGSNDQQQQLMLRDAAGGDNGQGDSFGHSRAATEGFELVGTTRQAGARGTDYWPILLRARYAPSMVAMRARTTTLEYANFVLLWTRFLVVLAVAVAFSLWRGPKIGLGLTGPRSPPRKARQASPKTSPKTVSRILDRPKQTHTEK